MSYFTAKCTKFYLGRGSAPDPAGGAHSTPPDLLTGFQGVLLLREGKGKGEGGERKGSGKVVMAFGGMGASGILFSKRNLYQKKNRARKHKYSDKILECVDNIGVKQL